MAIALGHRQRIALRYAGISVAALITFVFALQWTFPYDRVRDRLIEQLAPNYDVSIGDVKRGFWPGSVTFKGVTMAPRPTKAGDTPSGMYFESVHVGVGLFALVARRLSISFDVAMGPGRIVGGVKLPKLGEDGFEVDVVATDLVGRDLPFVALGMPPIIGKLDARVELTVPNMKTKAGRVTRDWAHADGTIAVSCPSGCALGDGKTKIKPLLKNRSSQSMVGDGIDFGKITIDALAIEGKFTPAEGRADEHSSAYKPGKFDLTKFDLKSKDGEVHLDFGMTLAPDIEESIVNGCIRFNVNESLNKTEEGAKAFAAVTTTGAERRADGLFHIKLSDHLKDMRRLNYDCGPNDKEQPPAAPLPHGPGVGNLRPPPSVRVPPPEPKAKPSEPTKPAEPAKPVDAAGSAPPPPGSAVAPAPAAPAGAPPAPPEGQAPPPEGETGAAPPEGQQPPPPDQGQGPTP